MKKRFLLTLVLSFAFLSKGFSNDFIPLNVEWVKDEHKYPSLITKQDEIGFYYTNPNHPIPSKREVFEYPHAYVYDKDGGGYYTITDRYATHTEIFLNYLPQNKEQENLLFPIEVHPSINTHVDCHFMAPFIYLLDEDNILFGNYSAMYIFNIQSHKWVDISYFSELRQQNIDEIIDVFKILFVEYDSTISRINVVYYAGEMSGDNYKYVYSDNWGQDWIVGTYNEECFPVHSFVHRHFNNGGKIWYEPNVRFHMNDLKLELNRIENCNKTEVFSIVYSQNTQKIKMLYNSYDPSAVYGKWGYDKYGACGRYQFDSKYSHLVWGPLYSNDYGNTLYMIENSPVPEEDIQEWIPQVFSDGRIYLAIWKKSGEAEYFIGTHHLVSVEDNNFIAGELSLYPNPTRDILHIRTDELISRVELSDLLGNVVISDLTPTLSKGEGVSINVENLPAGMYFLKLYTMSGEVLVEKVIVGF